MSVRKIETTIALDGEQEFKKGLASAAREMRVLESESKALAASFGTSGDAAAAAAAKQRNLQNQVAQQEQIVSALEQAVKDAAKAYGESSAEVDGYAIKLNNARARLANLQKALVSSDREVEELGRDAIKAGRQIEDGIGDGAREAQKELTDLMSTMQDSLSAIQSNTAVTAIKTVWDTASGAFQAVDGFVTGTADYRRQLSFLIQNAGKMDFGLAETEALLIKTQAITAEASSAIEGLSNLFRVEGMDEYRLNRVMESLFGAAITWPDTMTFQSLAESFQETLATGQAVGQYGELLGRLGVNLEKFNQAMKKSKTPEGDLEEAIAYMTSNELTDAYTKYKEENGDLIKEMETIARLEFQSARIGGLLARNITTPLKDTWADTLKWVNDTLETWEAEGLDAAIGKVKADIEAAKAALDAAMEAAGIPTPAEIMDGVEQLTPMGVAANILDKIGLDEGADFVRNRFKITPLFKEDETPYQVTPELQEEADTFKQAQREWFNMNDVATEAGAEAGADYAAGFADALDPSTWGEGKEAKPISYITDELLAEQEAFRNAQKDWFDYNELQEEGKEAGEQLMEGLEEGSEGAATAGKERGAAFGAAYAQGIMSQVSYVSAAAGALQAAAAAARAAAVPSVGAGGNLNLALNIDGKTFARATAPYMSSALAVAR